ncbi:MAG: cupin domain-containing protein [Clostridia bacterium]|nr:cupin domain-containing protein [Clostridia bacterium]
MTEEVLFGRGEKNPYGNYFIGQSYLKMLSTELGVGIANVTFEPGCRNHWHIHRASKGGGQILLVTSGEGWYQEENCPPQSLKPGDVVVISPNVKHWHGAKKDSWFTHIAIEVPGEDTKTEWCEPVSGEEYEKL